MFKNNNWEKFYKNTLIGRYWSFIEYEIWIIYIYKYKSIRIQLVRFFLNLTL